MIDTHAHLQMPDFDEDLTDVLDNATHEGIECIILVGFDVASGKKAIAIAERRERLFVSLGVHPHDASSMNDPGLKELRRLASHPKVVAIGETGLDFYRNLSPRESQIKAFRSQLELAEELRLPVVIHDRDAHEPTAQILSEHAKKLVGGVMHCFSGDAELAKRVLDWGFSLSVAGPLTYPNAKGLRSVVEEVPIESILLETDAPYLAPQPRRGKRNEPAFLRFVAEALAQVKGRSLDDVDRITSLNARRLFALPVDEPLEPRSCPHVQGT